MRFLIRMEEMKNFTKKAISAALSLAVAASYYLPCSAEGRLYGDLNGDLTVNAADALQVLTYCVGKTSLSEKQLILADVNADGRVNASDALEILRYTVGLTDRFNADKKNLVDAEEAVEAYNRAIEMVKTLRPSYSLSELVSSSVDDVKVSSKSILVSESMLREAEEQLKKDNSYNKKYVKIVKQKSDASWDRMIGKISSVSALKSVYCERSEDGNYHMTLCFKDEKNPTESSTIVKTLGQDTYEQAKEKVVGENEVGGATSKVEAFDFTYKDCILWCEIDPFTSEFKSIEWVLTCDSDSKVSTIGILAEMKAVGITRTTYSDFGY